MYKITYIIYRPETCNLQTKILLYQDQKKLLKQVDGSWLGFFINSNNKILQMKHGLCLKYVMIYRLDLWNLLIRVNS